MKNLSLTIILLLQLTISNAQTSWRFYFNSDGATLVDSSKTRLNEMLDLYKDKNNYTYYIEGHTDSTSTPQYNARLAEERASAIARQLISNGVKQYNISSSSYGERYPLTSNKTDKGRAINRRVEVFIEPADLEAANRSPYLYTITIYHGGKRDSVHTQIAIENDRGELISAQEIGSALYTVLKLDKNEAVTLKMIPTDAAPIQKRLYYPEMKAYADKVAMNDYGDTIGGTYGPMSLQQGSKDFIYNGISFKNDGQPVLTDQTKAKISTMLADEWPYFYVFEWVDVNPVQLWDKPKSLQLKEAFQKGKMIKESFDIPQAAERRMYYSGKVVYKPGIKPSSYLIVKRMY